ncbi:MAG TPA: hypothetical protein VEL03_06225 [Streptosporangiaceae bacterium]|nr:hypothetical protein [Streptosporangiaceae bacterium]
MTTDLGNGRGACQEAAVPTPSCIRPRRMLPAERVLPADRMPPADRVYPAERATAAEHGGRSGTASSPAIVLATGPSGRAAAREELEAALAGVQMSAKDRQFVGRLVHWDKRNAVSVGSLLRRARQAGRDEAALTPRQMEMVLAALADAARYRSSGVSASGCWDCLNIPSGRCAEHAKDDDRARAYTELAAALSGRGAQDGLPEPRDIAGYRRRRPVAS